MFSQLWPSPASPAWSPAQHRHHRRHCNCLFGRCKTRIRIRFNKNNQISISENYIQKNRLLLTRWRRRCVKHATLLILWFSHNIRDAQYGACWHTCLVQHRHHMRRWVRCHPLFYYSTNFRLSFAPFCIIGIIWVFCTEIRASHSSHQPIIYTAKTEHVVVRFSSEDLRRRPENRQNLAFIFLPVAIATYNNIHIIPSFPASTGNHSRQRASRRRSNCSAGDVFRDASFKHIE